jgi:putative PIN family toxin of toxin-antitoxin system
LDTNVIVSGILTPEGHCGRILDLLLEGHIPIVVDSRILAEYEEVLSRPRLALPQQAVGVFMDFIRSRAERVVAEPLRASLPDPSDLPFLEVASSSGSMLVTGNRRHFPNKACRKVKILSAAECIDLLRSLLN